MANDEAWSSGWSQGEGAAQKRKDKKNKQKDSQSNSSGSASGGGNPYSILSYLPKLHSGGKVKKTGAYRLKKGELVMTSTQQKSAGLKKYGKKKTAGRKRVASKG